MTPITEVGSSPPPTLLPGDDDANLDGALRIGGRLAAPAAALTFALADGGLDLVDLPPITSSAEDQARLRAVAPLYLVAELEATGLVRGAEVVAGLFVSGGLPGDVAGGGEPLLMFWRERHRRFSPEERSAIFARVFGEGDGPLLATRGARNTAFEGLLIDLAEAIYTLEPAWDGRPSPSSAVALQSAASALATNLVTRNAGVPDLAAAELIGTAQAAVEVFRSPGVQQAVGARSLWAAVQQVARRYLDLEPDMGSRVTRGKSGMLLLAWLAESLPRLSVGSDALAPPDSSATSAAGRWLEATLALREAEVSAGRSRG